VKTFGWFVLVCLLVGNTAGSGWMVMWHLRNGMAEANLPASQVAQADKLWNTVSAFKAELQSVTGGAQYPSEEEKQSHKTSLRDYELEFEIARAFYMDFKLFPSRRNLALVANNGRRLVNVPSFDTFDYRETPSRKAYANVSKLETLREDYVILGTALMKDVK
jgi:hypothetical protein